MVKKSISREGSRLGENLAYFADESREFSKDNLVICNIEEKNIEIIGNISRVLTSGNKDHIKLTLDEVIERISDTNSDTDIAEIWNKILQRNNPIKLEFKVRDKDDEILYLSVSLKPLQDEKGNLKSFFGLLHDITRERKIEKKLQKIIDFDVITKLPSKYYTKECIDEYLIDCKKKHLRGALLIVNVDNFKFVNDSYGHEDGDLLLKKVSIALKRSLNKEDLICRYSGDEFIIFRHDIHSIKEAEKLADKIKMAFDPPFSLKGRKIYITASIGIALAPDNGNDFNVLFKNADTAMNRAKSNGKDGFEFFDNSISTELNRIYAIEKGLRTAITDKEFYVVFQPKVVLEDSRVNGFEALLRWNSKELGLVGPTEFIPIAESTRLIVAIGRFVLEEVFKQIKVLLNEGNKNFKVAVNFSEVQFSHGTIIKDFDELINKYDVSPEYIEVEITESMLMKTCDDNIMKLQEIKNIGLSVALDDFGTGYSSLNYLTKLPIDVLKIDRSFVIDLLTNKKSRCIVENIIQLSHELGIDVVAEGVEEIEQVEYLKDILCDVVQGYYFSKPELFDDVKFLLGKKL